MPTPMSDLPKPETLLGTVRRVKYYAGEIDRITTIIDTLCMYTDNEDLIKDYTKILDNAVKSLQEALATYGKAKERKYG